jgi:hypothetical protein
VKRKGEGEVGIVVVVGHMHPLGLMFDAREKMEGIVVDGDPPSCMKRKEEGEAGIVVVVGHIRAVMVVVRCALPSHV